MTTNDQPSPANPTPTTPSEPEYSTGPDQLEWRQYKPGVFHADTKGGRYIVYDRLLYSSTGWTTVYLEEPTRLPDIQLYKGHNESEARAAAQAHHDAMVRRLAWERYMRDNDPPAIDLSFTTDASRNALSGAIDNPNAGAADPRDPATTHSRCRICDRQTQWGWCPQCQPSAYARLP